MNRHSAMQCKGNTWMSGCGTHLKAGDTWLGTNYYFVDGEK